MKDYRFHTPDGVSDILPSECFVKREMEKKLRTLFGGQGYDEIETPGFEYLDVFSGSGFVAAENLYKMTDGAGRLLGLRYDGTIPAARVAANLLKEETLPLRLSYIDKMYRFHESGGGRQKEFTQAGVEFLGATRPEADGEVIALAIAAAREIGIEDIQVSLGQVEFFLGLMEEWGVSGEDAEQISILVDQKDTVALERAAGRIGLAEADRKTLLMLPALFGTYDVLDAFAARVKGVRALAALDSLRRILRILDDYECLTYVSVDMGMLPNLDYYTGMIFKGFTYEIGFPIFSGGRYDKVISAFGRDVPAVGFSLGVNLCMTALRRQKRIPEQPLLDTIIGFEQDEDVCREAISLLRELRGTGKRVILDCQGMDEDALEAYAEKKDIQEIIFLKRQ